MKRVVADTNVLISALIFGGIPLTMLESARQRRFVLVTSPVLLDELDETLGEKFGWSIPAVDRTRNRLEQLCEVVSTMETIHVVLADPDDDRVLECAVAGHADVIVSGDRNLLSLGSCEGIVIITARQFLDQLLPAT